MRYHKATVGITSQRSCQQMIKQSHAKIATPAIPRNRATSMPANVQGSAVSERPPCAAGPGSVVVDRLFVVPSVGCVKLGGSSLTTKYQNPHMYVTEYVVNLHAMSVTQNIMILYGRLRSMRSRIEH